MADQAEYNPLDPEFEARMRAKREATRRERARASTPGTRRFGEWELLELIGEGPAARVHRARGPKGELAALKCLRGSVVEGVERPGARERFLDSMADRLRALEHPNLLRILDLVRDGDRRALLLEAREADETLDALLRRRPALPWKESLRIAAAIADALSVLDFAHDDVKPRNIFLGEDGGVLLADPSSAREILEDGGDRAIALSGSPQYMAPERLRGESGSAAGDVYSLGSVLYQMLSGRLPYRGPLVAQLRDEQERGTHAKLDSPLGALPAELIEVVDSMLESSPERRPTLGQLRERLSALAELPETAGQSKGSSVLRRALIAMAVLAFLLLLILRTR